jgi:hypothetical protein
MKNHNILHGLNHNTNNFSIQFSFASKIDDIFSGTKRIVQHVCNASFLRRYVFILFLTRSLDYSQINLRSIWNLIFFYVCCRLFMLKRLSDSVVLKLKWKLMEINWVNEIKIMGMNRFYWTFFIFGMNFLLRRVNHIEGEKKICNIWSIGNISILHLFSINL